MAIKGSVYLIGKGENQINPIHGEDLAEVCLSAINQDQKEIAIGGPEIFSMKEIAQLSFELLDKPSKINKIPTGLMKLLASVVGVFSGHYKELMNFFIYGMQQNGIANKTGNHKLKDYLLEFISSKKIN